jgi:hypothetical protein
MIFGYLSPLIAQPFKLHGMYFQWGYNKEWYTKSNIHFKLANGSDFILHQAKAHDKPDMKGIYEKPFDISIPQYNYRIGFYLNSSKTRAIELNFDHTKYVVTDGQKVNVTGTIEGVPVSGDSILNRNTFLHFEHTDGANFLHVNYVWRKPLLFQKDNTTHRLDLMAKLGAGINIPRTDVTWKGDRLNNKFHIAGYNISTELGIQYYFSKRFFLETTAKTGFVKYTNALANTNQFKNSFAKHSFGYFEVIGLIGYDIPFKNKKKDVRTQKTKAGE